MPKFAKGNPDRFKKGKSGNPGGRPKSRAMTASYEARLDRPLPPALIEQLNKAGGDFKTGATYRDALALGQVLAGIKGATEAAKEIANRVEGRIPLAPPANIDTGNRKVIFEIEFVKPNAKR
jgi:hypothetical protein